MKNKIYLKEATYESSNKPLRGALDFDKRVLDLLVNKGILTTEDCCIYELIGGSSESYLVYSALLSQEGTNDPNVIVLKNTLGGTPIWTRDMGGLGGYYATLVNAFTEDKTWAIAISTGYNGEARVLQFGRANNDQCVLYSRTIGGAAADLETGGFYEVSVEIRVYP